MAKDKSPESSVADADPLSGFPEGVDVSAAKVVCANTPANEDYTGLHKRGDELFKLAIIADDPSGKTHFLKNKIHFCHITAAEYREQFEKQ